MKEITLMVPILVVILIAGCTTPTGQFLESGKSYSSIEDINKNPLKYKDNKVVLKGIMSCVYSSKTDNSCQLIDSDFTVEAIKDNQGYLVKLINLEPNRIYYYNENYEVIGIVKVDKLCTCQHKVMGWSVKQGVSGVQRTEEWYNDWDNPKVVENCLEEEDHRCAPDSELLDEPKLYVLEMAKL